jgi:1-deoxy-D-xylulose-5-phosphate reductoisomerase
MERAVKRVTVLGATGSIGCSTADIMLRHPDKFSAYVLVGYRNSEKMLQLAEQLNPDWVVMIDSDAAAILEGKLPTGTRLASGMDAAIDLCTASETDMVMAAMVGSAGVPATLAAVQAGKHVCLANKECLVTAGRIIMAEAKRSGAKLLPVDSEHAAVHQCLSGQHGGSVSRVILTASGGPFWQRDPATLHSITPQEAVAHPNWDMGAKISVDSATMMNKALELIEARWLFDLAPEKLSAIIHPESIIHAMVEYTDGSVLAQLAMPDMRMPVAYAMQVEPRLETGVPWLDITQAASLHFQAIDTERFPAMQLVRDVMNGEDSLAIAFNASNEVANAAFLQHRIGFMDIVAITEEVLAKVENVPVGSLDDVWLHDEKARILANEVITA